MNLNSDNVFRGSLVSVYMGAEYDKRNGKVDKLEG